MQAGTRLMFLAIVTTLVHGGIVKREDTAEFTNCGDPDQELLTIKEFTLEPEDVVFPGNVTLRIHAEVKQDIEPPVSAEIFRELQVNVRDYELTRFGYYYYEDFCEYMEDLGSEDCEEDELCQCPFKKGTYTLPEVTFVVSCPIPGPGSYHILANFTASGALVTCLEFSATFGEDD